MVRLNRLLTLVTALAGLLVSSAVAQTVTYNLTGLFFTSTYGGYDGNLTSFTDASLSATLSWDTANVLPSYSGGYAATDATISLSFSNGASVATQPGMVLFHPHGSIPNTSVIWYTNRPPFIDHLGQLSYLGETAFTPVLNTTSGLLFGEYRFYLPNPSSPLLDLANGTAPNYINPSAGTFDLFASAGGSTITFSPTPNPQDMLNVNIFNGSAVQVSAIPEPSTYAALLGLGALGLAALRRRRSARR